MIRYRTIVADPPWHYPFGHPAREHKKHPYSTMTIGELCELPVQDWADQSAHLYLWTTNEHLRYPSKKVAHAIWSWREPRRQAEIAKCDVLCGTCHDGAHREAQRIEAALKSSHGTIQSYWRGCRCDSCRAARRDYK